MYVHSYRCQSSGAIGAFLFYAWVHYRTMHHHASGSDLLRMQKEVACRVQLKLAVNAFSRCFRIFNFIDNAEQLGTFTCDDVQQSDAYLVLPHCHRWGM